jgi:hypothetical protein
LRFQLQLPGQVAVIDEWQGGSAGGLGQIDACCKALTELYDKRERQRISEQRTEAETGNFFKRPPSRQSESQEAKGHKRV